MTPGMERQDSATSAAAGKFLKERKPAILEVAKDKKEIA